MEMIPKENYVSPRSTWITKLLLRAASILICIILAGVGGVLATTNQVSPYFMAYVAPAIIICFIWSIAEGTCIWVRGGHRGIHPGAIVAVDLIIWLGLAFVCTILGLSSLVYGYGYGYYSYYGSYSYYDYNRGRYVYSSGPSTSERTRILGLGRALFAFFVLLTIAHFALFVIGCVETNIRNRLPKTVYVMQPVYAHGQPIPGQFQMAQGTQFPIQPPAPVHAGAPVKSTEPGPERFA